MTIFTTAHPQNRPRVRAAMLATDAAFQKIVPPNTRAQAADAVLRMDRIWYDSFDTSAVYGHPDYWLALVDCWCRHKNQGTRNTTYQACNWMLSSGYSLGTICDLHAGMGHASVMMSLATGEKVYAHITQSEMQDICRRAADEAGANVEVVAEPVPASIVTAFEVLEHIDRPLDFLLPALEESSVYMDSSSWTVRANGHWESFEVNGETVPAESMKQRLASALSSAGFVPYDKLTGFRFRDSRPRVFVRQQKDEARVS